MEPSLLSNPSGRIAADTSVIINLASTKCGAEILRAIPERIVIPDIVLQEVEDGRKKGYQQADALLEFRKAGLIDTQPLGDAGESLFERLVIGPANATLDDGEAATIAYAVENNIGVIVDDRKARRICKEQFHGTQIRCSTDVFRHEAVEKALGKDRLAEAVFDALKIAHMRVLPENIEWAVGLIGTENAKLCRSLPQRSPILAPLKEGSRGSR